MSFFDKVNSLSETVDKISKSVNNGLDTFLDGTGTGGPNEEPEQKPCPFCGESMPISYVKCPSCGRFLDGSGSNDDLKNLSPLITVDMSKISEPEKVVKADVDLDKKILALTKLMTDGIITASELTKLVSALSTTTEGESSSMTPVERAYYEYVDKYIAPSFKSPSAVKPAPFDSSMVKEGAISLNGSTQHTKYIESYVDAPNSYGTMLREEFIIGIDEDFNMYWHAMHVNLGVLLGKTSGWVTR